MASVEGMTRRLRSTMDSVLIHDMKNMEFRLNLLLSNFEEHYGDPDFKRSVVEHLSATLDKIESIVDRWAAHQDAVLIKVSLDVNDLVRRVVREVKSAPLRGSRNPARLRVTTSFEEVPPVWGDPYYLTDALTSVFRNAFEAAAASGSSVRLRTASERRGRKRSVLIEIADDGGGMSPEFIQRRLFRPFQTTKSHGVGLGLYTARQIILFHRGAIDVVSEPGEGTRVRISLPAVAARRS